CYIDLRYLHSFPTRRSSDLPFELPCNHRRGRTYKEKVAFLEMREVSFKEYSIVNAPADERSGVRTVGVQQTFESSESSDTARVRSEEHTSELQSRENLVCRL